MTPSPADLPPALAAWLPLLRCPTCADTLTADGRSLRCPQRHSFDRARAGYVSLLGGAGAVSGDDESMARARERFLTTGAYDPLLTALGDLAEETVPALRQDERSTVLDAGCGPGWYLAGMLERFDGAVGLGLDTSARSLRSAARAHERAAAVTGDVFAPFPLATGSVDLLLDVFAPRNPGEFARVLRPGGALLVARPAEAHLAELREVVPGMVSVDPRKEERLHRALDPLFTLVAEREVHSELVLTAEQAQDLVAMTPSARHVDPATVGAALASTDGLAVRLDVRLSAHRPR
ncbi:methyltransferase domain-containing protein [Brachybacterium sp. J144]|uniref:putative RNA methyltransferase n=1 Tax=Brachybacterium sp. J144 TaxID=3116487 RepID=UPI002E79E623|nr:methyltransferase domain-containing protein [Brachybacterium sp. J144]MEE1651701.1 methyltransferase domain-containing protein [Brachybacterium sp. J144]